MGVCAGDQKGRTGGLEEAAEQRLSGLFWANTS